MDWAGRHFRDRLRAAGPITHVADVETSIVNCSHLSGYA